MKLSSQLMDRILKNIQDVKERVASACKLAGRDPKSVTILGVSKTYGVDSISAAFDAGLDAFGENYIAEAVQKKQALASFNIKWHCIGPIQSNKTRLVAENFDWVHTVDRIKIAQRLSEQRPKYLNPLQVCIQVNVDSAQTKSGVKAEEVLPLAIQIADLPGLQLRGLMAIPDPILDYEVSCQVFRRVKCLWDDMRQYGLAVDTLSMGMSLDLEAAIQAGSTIVRVGTAIFGVRDNPLPPIKT